MKWALCLSWWDLGYAHGSDSKTSRALPTTFDGDSVGHAREGDIHGAGFGIAMDGRGRRSVAGICPGGGKGNRLLCKVGSYLSGIVGASTMISRYREDEGVPGASYFALHQEAILRTGDATTGYFSGTQATIDGARKSQIDDGPCTQARRLQVWRRCTKRLIGADSRRILR